MLRRAGESGGRDDGAEAVLAAEGGVLDGTISAQGLCEQFGLDPIKRPS